LNYTENKNLHWYNIPSIHSKTVTIKDIFFRQIYKKTGLKKGTPMILYMLNGEIQGLDKFRHSDGFKKIINEKGLHIYLYEPICSKVRESDEYTAGFYSEFLYDPLHTDLFCDEFESIKRYVTKNKLTSVTVHTCDYDVEKYYTGYSKYFKIICDDIFLRNQNFIGKLDVGYKETSEFTKRFICPNWRYTKHRHLVSSFLQDKDCYVSWYYKASVVDLKKELWFDLSEWADHFPDVYNKIVTGAVNLEIKAPISMDVNVEKSTPIFGKRGHKNIYPIVDVNPCLLNHGTDSLRDFFRRAFCCIVTESRFAQPTANISEKTLMAMHFRRPFIVLGPPRTLKYLKSLGFKTFSDFWDESYDDIDQHDKRLLEIFDLIDEIYSFPQQKINEMYREMSAIIDHNEKEIINLYNGRKNHE
jgi:hypothetical protein